MQLRSPAQNNYLAKMSGPLLNQVDVQSCKSVTGNVCACWLAFVVRAVPLWSNAC